MNNKIVMYDNIISFQNIHEAWCEFVSGKKKKMDVAEFQLRLSFNLYSLHDDLRLRTYRHGPYEAFAVNDPKPRSIHKAHVRDRLLHHAVYRVLYPYFDRKFIYDSYSCRNYKGTHRAVDRFGYFAKKVSMNHRRTCWVLKCDVKKFFASVDHSILMALVKRHISDPDIILLIQNIIGSFCSTEMGKGLPLGNLTSQLLVNVYMNEFDQFIKHRLKLKYYIRYADDFVIMHHDLRILQEILPKVREFLGEHLGLTLHPDKVYIKTFASGVDFLGWVNFPTHRVLRTTTKRRMFKRLERSEGKPETIQSYLGMIKHGNAYKLGERIEKYKRCDEM